METNTTVKKQPPELLAPAGSIDSFHAAVEAGADAIYLGINELNARIRAKNFTIKTLSFLVPYAHSKDIKIYVTLNTLAKENELKELLNTLYKLDQIGVDAVIVQDLGVAYLIKNNFPKLEMHASTQMVIHNLAGVKACEKLGFSRVVLSRELSMREIAKISDRTKMELEIFIHGALCYSISGLCLASSYLGGSSGNRGRCTQVCRRKFKNNHREGFYFSAKDLQALDYTEQMQLNKISSLKIEGRMKSAEYVFSVVKAYRKALNNKELIDESRVELETDLGREKTPFFLKSTEQTGIVNAVRPAGVGIELGTVATLIRDEKISIFTEKDLFVRDRLRFQSSDGGEGVSSKVIEITTDNNLLICTLKSNNGISIGDSVFVTSRAASSHPKNSKTKVDLPPNKYKEYFPATQRVLGKLHSKKKKSTPSKKETLYFRIDNLNWFHLVKNEKSQGIILNFEMAEYQELLSNKNITPFLHNLIASVPPFIPQTEVSIWKDICEKLYKKGIHRFICTHFSQKEFLPEGASIISDSSVWAINRATQKSLLDQGFENFTYSVEDDILNLKATADRKGLIYLFSYVPLFISRIHSPLKEDSDLLDERGAGFFTARRFGLDYLIGSRPLCLTHRKGKLKEIGINSFILDLSFTPPTKKTLRTLMDHYHSGAKLPDTTLFNHKGGLI